MFSAGSLEMPWRRFLAADGLAAGVWSGYAAGLGIVGGQTFAHSVFKPLLVALAVGLLVTAASELYRRRRLTGDKRRIARRERRFKREARAAERDRAAA
jgi:membrane protein DedA with SNARE-associated domain